MMKRTFTREEFQTILEKNNLGCDVSYIDRPNHNESFDNWIVYHIQAPNNKLFTDNLSHVKKARVLLTHFHKKKLDSIASFIKKQFGVDPSSYAIKQPKIDFWGTYYEFEIFAIGDW